MRLEIVSKSDNDRTRSKQNCQVNCDFLRTSKYRRKIFETIIFNKSRIINNQNGNRKDTVVDDEIIER